MTRSLPAWMLAAGDVGLVACFAALGRRSHEHGLSAAGIAQTAWPFLVGLGVGWLIVGGSRRQAPRDLSGGLVVWVATVAGGMLLRALTGAGTAPTFVLVAGAVTAIFLFGWRLVARRLGA